MRPSARSSVPARQPSGGTQPKEAKSACCAMPGMRLPAGTVLAGLQGVGEQKPSR
jgi:hypothetical protein